MSPTRTIVSVATAAIVSLVTACNAPRHYDVSPQNTNARTTMVLFNAPPMIDVLDVGFPGASPGDTVVWHAPLTTSRGDLSTEVGLAIGTMTRVRVGQPALPGEDGARDHRATSVEFGWHESPDSMVILGGHPYAAGAVESDVAILRAIVGGTGRFIGARGEMTSTPLGDGWYEHRIVLVD
jgi:hypothetical protein